MSGLIETIGLFSSVLSIVSFFEDLFPSTPSVTSNVPAGLTTVRIGVAKDGTSAAGTITEAKGRIGQINLYNEDREKISSNSFYKRGDPSGLVRDGSFTDFNLDCQGQQPTYLQIFGHEDAICIAYIMHTWPDGTKRGWSGDIGSLCGVSHWSYSNIIVGRTPNGKNYKPACTWLDWDHNTGITLPAMQIHISDFFVEDATNSTSLSKDTYCSAPNMIFQDGHPSPSNDIWSISYDPSINGVDGMGKRRAARRGAPVRKRSPRMESQLVISDDPDHSAKRLCQSDMSHSADFVSLDEGLFCDMGSKTLWPLCGNGVTDDCFDKEEKALVVKGDRQQRNYHDVQVWE